MFCVLLALFYFAIALAELDTDKHPISYEILPVNKKFDNVNQIRDRFKHKGHHNSPAFFPEHFKDQHKLPFHPSDTDYCDPYHCNDYHKPACGLNRDTTKFRWFQSACHIKLWNKCAYGNGNIKYDSIEPKFCSAYVMFGRSGCPTSCAGEPTRPICAASVFDTHVVLFRNQCALDMANCENNEYDVVSMEVCDMLLSNSNETSNETK